MNKFTLIKINDNNLHATSQNQIINDVNPHAALINLNSQAF